MRKLYFWYAIGCLLILLGAFFAYAGTKLLDTPHASLGMSLGVLGLLLFLWGGLVTWRCLRVRES